MAKLTKRMMFRMSDEDAAFLEQESEREGCDRSDVVRGLIKKAQRERRDLSVANPRMPAQAIS